MTKRRQTLRLESLEARFTPATLVNPKTITFQDSAGNTATVAFNKPVLSDANVGSIFTFDAGGVNGDNGIKQKLLSVDLIDLPGGLSLSVTGTDANGTPTRADVGIINATDKDVKSIFVSGDISRVIAGDPNTRTPGLGKLSVGSIGVAAGATAQPGDLNTEITGALGKLTVDGDVRNALVFVMGRLGPVQVAGSIFGAAWDDSGRIQAEGSIGTVNVTGALVGGAGNRTGTIFTGERLGAVTIGGDITGAGGAFSGSIFGSAISRLTVGGSIVGADGPSSGTVSTGRIGKTTIGGNLTGGIGASSGALALGRAGAVEITGDVTGGDGASSASIAGERLPKISIGGSLIGGKGDFSAQIQASRIGSVSIGGAVHGGPGHSHASIVADRYIGRVDVHGNWSDASIVAGWSVGPDLLFGTDDDIALTDDRGRVIAGVIAYIKIGGIVEGTSDDGDHFAFQAAHIKSLNVNNQKLALKAGAKNDSIAFDVNGDFELVEK